ncbi:hypothetical protein PIN31009_03373 [Pandoraea iniqua]|uniref:Uncharacterized protein n=1 Tax=Pandoraea iniqua TaxID=2508288 RepID=A0A5E4WMA7_9BURK|nr:hypothetical protein [Pandoraea iniqua]VVE18207.1 hypothetical protein PIN31115_02988 [Pandoraea iniqua]VVE26087.1 hypothetical protein PIN31009_03373 [Pandoraea iniqua]
MTENDVLAMEQRAAELVHAQVLGMLLAHMNHLDGHPDASFDVIKRAMIGEIARQVAAQGGTAACQAETRMLFNAAVMRAADSVFDVADVHNAAFFRRLQQRKVAEEPALD